jgi:ATP-dependent RNA helicase DDX56/DBP9
MLPSLLLAPQVVSEASAVAAHSGVPISVTNLTGEAAAAQRTSLVGAGALVVATPGRLATALREGWLTPAGLQGLTMVVLDEADLLLSYGYEEDLQALAPMVGGAAERGGRRVGVAARGTGASCQLCGWQIVPKYPS